MEKKFRETLHNHGLDEHFIHANSFRLQEAHHSDDDSEKFKTEQEEIETDSQSSGSEECDSRHESVHSNEHSDIISVSSSKCTSELPERDLS